MRTRIALAALIAIALTLAWIVRFGCDDAFISYVYSRNLVYGDGLTWFGDHVEGYTNFGWVLWNAVGFFLGADPLRWSWASSLVALAAVLVLAFRITKLRTGSDVVALTTVALLTTNYTFLAYGTSGLETMAQCALLTAAFFEVERMRRIDAEPSPRRLVLLSLLAGLALWTRLDSAVYLVVLAVAAAAHLVRVRASRIAWVCATAPALGLVGGWLAWKLSYYGELLPNTFHAKVAVSSRTVVFATKFLWWFVAEYGLYILLAAAAGIAITRRRFTAKLPLALVVAWAAYIVYTGGDFMEFRFCVPLMPPLFIVIAETIASDGAPERVKPWLRGVLVVAIAASLSLKHGVSWKGGALFSVDNIRALRNFYGVVPDHDWARLGTPVADALFDTDAVIACNGAGAIPYYADIPTVDQLGLNDRWVARNGVPAPELYVRPGHQRFAPLAYLEQRKVNFVIGTPFLVQRGLLAQGAMTKAISRWITALLGPIPIDEPALTIVGVPVSASRSMLMWYRLPTPAIDARIRAAGWETTTFYKTGP
jgi:arabinofuranosyltransferase